MEDISVASEIIPRFDFMTSIDLKYAYFVIPIHSSSRKHLRFKFYEHICEFQCSLFGLSSVPFVFTKLMKPVTTYLTNRGYLLVIYLLIARLENALEKLKRLSVC